MTRTTSTAVALLTALFVVLTPPAVAEPAGMHVKLNRMLDLMHLDDAHREGLKTCIEGGMSGPFSPSEHAKSNGSYYGFTPESPSWKQVQAVHRRYLERGCAYMTLDELRYSYLEFYARRVDEKSLDAWLTFMSSSAGQSFIRVQEDFIRELNTVIGHKYQSSMAQAQRRLEEELRELRPAKAGGKK